MSYCVSGHRSFSHRPQAPNGMNFSRAIYNPSSLIARIVNYLRANGPQTKAVLLDKALDKGHALRPTVQEGTYNGKKYRHVFPPSARGYASYTFGLAVKLGILEWERTDGNTIVWSLGPMATIVVKA